MIHGRNPIHGANHIQQEVSTMLGACIALSLSTSTLVVTSKKHSLTKTHKRNKKSILSSTSLTSLINQHDVA